MTGHDPLCPLRQMSLLKSGCPQCNLVRTGRADGIRLALATVDKGGRAATQLQALLAEHDTHTGDAA